MGTFLDRVVLNIKTALAIGEMVVSSCEEVVASWQTGLSQPMQPWGQNNSQGQSKIFIYLSEIIHLKLSKLLVGSIPRI